jgi:hypothetical protein
MRDPYFPFQALGFRSNPFRALTDDEWAEIVVLPAGLVAAAAAGHVQVLGEMGHGKTSALLGLARRFRLAGQKVAYEYLALGQETFKTAPAGLDVFLLDEAQRLRSSERRRLLAAGPRLVLGSHEDLVDLFAGAGLRLGSVRLEGLTLAELETLLERRLAAARMPAAPAAVTFDATGLAYLQSEFGGDLRAMERFLYEVFQSLETPGVLTADHLRALADSPLDGLSH